MFLAALPIANAQALRRELSERNQRYARKWQLPHVLSYGEEPAVVFEPFKTTAGPRHGNFLPATYEAILGDPRWRKRLEKPHSQARCALPSNGRRWMELDSSNSSDGLLMNVFCYPRVFQDRRLCRCLGVEPGARPEFGVKARVPLAGDKFDRTEVDMRLGDLLVEAKLTESDFQTKAVAEVGRYRDFAEVFDIGALPRRDTVAFSPVAVDDESVNQDVGTWDIDAPRAALPSESPASSERVTMRRVGERYLSYQLIRNVLAAHAAGARFCVIHDARRPDLREAWFAIMSCIRDAALRTRCQVLTWQELAALLPPRLQDFLAQKYGIIP